MATGVLHGTMGGDRWNRIVDGIVSEVMRQRSNVMGELLIDGYPPGTAPLSPYEEYLKLSSMSLSADPVYVNSPQAQARLAQLTLRFGQVQPYQSAFAPAVANNPELESRYATRESTALPSAPLDAPVVPGT